MTAGAAARIRSTVEPTWASIAVLTLSLGMTVAISWLAIGGGAAYRGQMPVRDHPNRRVVLLAHRHRRPIQPIAASLGGLAAIRLAR